MERQSKSLCWFPPAVPASTEQNDAGARGFPDISLNVPWRIEETQCPCGFQSGNFSYGKKLPDKFPAHGISLSESHIDQQLFPSNIYDVAERALALAGKFQRDSAFSYAQVSDAQEVEPLG